MTFDFGWCMRQSGFKPNGNELIIWALLLHVITLYWVGLLPYGPAQVKIMAYIVHVHTCRILVFIELLFTVFGLKISGVRLVETYVCRAQNHYIFSWGFLVCVSYNSWLSLVRLELLQMKIWLPWKHWNENQVYSIY